VQAEVAIRPAGVPPLADLFRQIEDDRHRQNMILPGQPHQRLPGLPLHIGGIHHRQPPGGQTLGGDVVQHVEGVVRRGLIVFVIADQATAIVAR